MPSIPQSLLWISLVVLWLFVLVPMLINRRDTVRRTSDVALATRVLNSGARAARLIKRGGPAAGHRSDPDWRPEAEDELEDFDEDDTGPVVVTGKPSRMRSVAVVTALAEEDEPDYLDVDVVDEDSGALPVGAKATAEPAAEPQTDELPLEFASAETESVKSTEAEEPVEAVEAAAQDESPRSPTGRRRGRGGAGRHRRRIRIRRGHLGSGARGRRACQPSGAIGALRDQDRGRGQRAQVPVPDPRADHDGRTAHRLGHGGVPVDADSLVRVCHTRGDHPAVPGLSAPPDPDRGAVAPSPHAARGPRAARRGEAPTITNSTWCRPDYGARALRCSRSTTKTRCSSISTTLRSPGNSTCRAQRGSDKPVSDAAVRLVTC